MSNCNKTEGDSEMDRKDTNRAELRCHSVHSPMDGVATERDILRETSNLGTKVIAITDTDSVNAFSTTDWLTKSDNYDSKVIMGVDTQVEGDQITILVRSEEGRNNLYKLLSIKNTRANKTLFWSDVNEYHDGLLIGSGALNGKLYKLLKAGNVLSDDLAELYDYVEVLPAFALVEDENTSLSEWQEKTIELISFAERNGLKAVAVSDAYTYVKEDEFVRKVLAFSDSNEPHSERFLSTDEMMDAFDFIENEDAYKLVVSNSNQIANDCEQVRSTVGKKAYPILDNMNERLKDICYAKAHELYGEAIPDEIEQRIRWELEAIRKTDSAFEILLLKELLHKNGITGDEVSIRGTASASLVVFLCGISNYNPIDFHLEPYFTFGIKQDRVLNIPINVPANRHEDILESCKNLEGLKTSIRAGVECCLSDEEIDSIVSLYDRKRKKIDSSERIFLQERLGDVVSRKNDVHIGGMVYIPLGMDEIDATPIKKCKGEYATTKDYYSFDDVFYKQDILPHEDVQLLVNLKKRTGVDLRRVNMDDKEILSLFNSTEALGIVPTQINGFSTGLLGLSEFASPWMQQVILQSPIGSFDDVVKVTSLAHGTGTWMNNAEILIKEGTSCLSDVIASREDVFDYLTKRGFSQEKAFEIAERVRKGRALTTEDKELMLQNNVPNWYVESCDKIKYLFPRSHSISYIVQLWELAYFKIHYPKSFYDEFFRMKKFGSLNDAINQGYESFCEYSNEMLSGFGRHELTIREYEAILLAQEMYARGAEFVME